MLPEPYAGEIKGISKAAGLEIGMYIRPLVKGAYQKLIFLFSTKTYVVGTQKNCLNQTVLLSTQNIC